MHDLSLIATKETPEIYLSLSTCSFEGRSLPENAYDFYQSVQDWFKNFNENVSNKELEISFKFDYINTSTSKQLGSILCLIIEISKKNNVSIVWKYYENDTDMKSIGIRFKKLFDKNFQVVSIEE